MLRALIWINNSKTKNSRNFGELLIHINSLSGMEINLLSKCDRILVFLGGIFALWYHLHWVLYQEYLDIRILNNLIVLTELFPTLDLLDWRIHTHTHTHTHTHIYIYIYIYTPDQLKAEITLYVHLHLLCMAKVLVRYKLSIYSSIYTNKC